MPLASSVTVLDTEDASTGIYDTYPVEVCPWPEHPSLVNDFISAHNFGDKEYQHPGLKSVKLLSESEHAAKLSNEAFYRVNEVLQAVRPGYVWSLHPPFRRADGYISRHPDAGSVSYSGHCF